MASLFLCANSNGETRDYVSCTCMAAGYLRCTAPSFLMWRSPSNTMRSPPFGDWRSELRLIRSSRGRNCRRNCSAEGSTHKRPAFRSYSTSIVRLSGRVRTAQRRQDTLARRYCPLLDSKVLRNNHHCLRMARRCKGRLDRFHRSSLVRARTWPRRRTPGQFL